MNRLCGLVTGACLSEVGDQIICYDINNEKLDLLNNEISPFYEPGRNEMIQCNIASGKLTFS